MSEQCCAPPPTQDRRFKRVLWIALVVNLGMFLVEIGGGIASDSTSLLADAADFFGDATNYAISLWVLPFGLAWRARAALIKGISMAVYGASVIAYALYNLFSQVVPEAMTMGAIGTLAFFANFGVAVLLYRFRSGDANMRSVWLCTRNDAIGNLAVIAAALGVFGTQTGWPDYIVAAIMATLALTASVSVIRRARAELRGEVLEEQDAHGHMH
ncbi:MAG TPA: cation transporter [Burkholderiales bacterium]|nr:cation transporter [Burkholderiales bacterium]